MNLRFVNNEVGVVTVTAKGRNMNVAATRHIKSLGDAVAPRREQENTPTKLGIQSSPKASGYRVNHGFSISKDTIQPSARKYAFELRIHRLPSLINRSTWQTILPIRSHK